MAIGQYPVGSHTVSGGVASSGLKFYIQKASKYCIHTAQIIIKSCSYATTPLTFDRIIVQPCSYIIQKWMRRYHIIKYSTHKNKFFTGIITKLSNYRIKP